jgi:citrate lyase gamma subunit
MSITSPVKFAKGLSDPIQDTRLATMELLKSWMESKGIDYEFTSIELDQLWRALQYSFWMCDKRPIQQQFAAESALFIRKIKPEFVIEWNRAFWFNIERIYQTLDKYRVPKFHLLIRIYISEMINQMMIREFEIEFVDKVIQGFIENVLHASGAYIHVTSIFIDELLAITGEDKIPEYSMMKLCKIGLNVVENIEKFPTSVVAKTCDTFLTNSVVIQYSQSIRSTVKNTIQSVAMRKETDQDVRDILFGFIEVIDGIPVKVRSSGKKDSPIKKNKADKDGKISKTGLISKKKVKKI